MASNLFHFITLRPPEQGDTTKLTSRTVRAYGSPGEESSLHLRLRNARNSANARTEMERLAGAYMASSEFVAGLEGLSTPLGELDRQLSANDFSDSPDSLVKTVAQIFDGSSAADLVTSEKYQLDRRRLADSVVAASIQPQGASRAIPHLIRGMRLTGLLERIAAQDVNILNSGRAVARALRGMVLLPADLFPLPPGEPIKSLDG
jgi:hypothetical protein